MRLLISLIIIAQVLVSHSAFATLPIGMNLPGISYYDPVFLFTDVMKTGEPRADATNTSDLSSSKFYLFPRDANGYPTTVPYSMYGNTYAYVVYINSLYTGEYVLLYEGEGSISVVGKSTTTIDGKKHFTLTGTSSLVSIRVDSVTEGNHIRNIRVIPVEYLGNEQNMPVFRPDYMAGLTPFNTLRFMDLARTNASVNIEWANRNPAGSITQGDKYGVAWEYIIAIANQLNADAWITVPHQASDDYITQLATLFKNTLNSNLKLYIEYSNELWNWPFDQAQYLAGMGGGYWNEAGSSLNPHPNSYVIQGLARIATPRTPTFSGQTVTFSTLSGSQTEVNNETTLMFESTGTLPTPLQPFTSYYVINKSGNTAQLSATHNGTAITFSGGSGTHTSYGWTNQEKKAAYMMARSFRLFDAVWGVDKTRLVHVATGQAANAYNSGQILNYLVNTDGIGADAIAVGGYTYYNSADHTTWIGLEPGIVGTNVCGEKVITPAMVLQSANDYYDTHTGAWVTATKGYADTYGVDYMVYEGGQHMDPKDHVNWCYNHAIWDSQISSGMYDLYSRLLASHIAVDTKLFMAFSYMGSRNAVSGSWGHLENTQQLALSPGQMIIQAPKYQALIDFNTPRTVTGAHKALKISAGCLRRTDGSCWVW